MFLQKHVSHHQRPLVDFRVTIIIKLYYKFLFFLKEKIVCIQEIPRTRISPTQHEFLTLIKYYFHLPNKICVENMYYNIDLRN